MRDIYEFSILDDEDQLAEFAADIYVHESDFTMWSNYMKQISRRLGVTSAYFTILFTSVIDREDYININIYDKVPITVSSNDSEESIRKRFIDEYKKIIKKYNCHGEDICIRVY